MPNVMAALPNIGGALCSTPQSLANAHYLTAVLREMLPVKTFCGRTDVRTYICTDSLTDGHFTL